MKTILIGILFFAVGVFGSDFILGAYRLFSGDVEVKCLPDSGPCVGDKLSETYIGGLYLFDKIGGLDYIVCEDLNPDIIDEEILFVNAIIKGERCEGAIEGLGFRNTTTSTFVVVKKGEITKIRRGPLHAVDM